MSAGCLRGTDSVIDAIISNNEQHVPRRKSIDHRFHCYSNCCRLITSQNNERNTNAVIVLHDHDPPALFREGSAPSQVCNQEEHPRPSQLYGSPHVPPKSHAYTSVRRCPNYEKST